MGLTNLHLIFFSFLHANADQAASFFVTENLLLSETFT